MPPAAAPRRKAVRPVTVRGHRLDRQQTAVVRDGSFTQLVVAGAGTGKTTTLIGKVKYLTEEEGIDPGRILLVSLTNSSVADLKAAVKKEFGEKFPADVMTIHALGNRILRKHPCIGSQKSKLIAEICDELVQTDRKSAEAMMKYIEGLRRTSYSYLSYNGKTIGSRGLRTIADALFECGINCSYSRPVYSDKDGRPGYISAEYGNGLSFRMYSDDSRVSAAARDPEQAWEILKSKNIPLRRMNVNDLASGIIQAWGERIPESLGNLISRCKCIGTSIRDLRRANGRNETSVRADTEPKIDLLDRVWDMYSMACAENDLADYEDMIIQSAETVRRLGYSGKRYDAVLIDEYQDVSGILVDLVKAIRGVMRFRLFCVGDDWQSIYSFSGGDVWQMFDFEKIWAGWGSLSVSRIEKTYRSPKQIAEMTDRFISKNPAQLRKRIRGTASSGCPVQLLPVSSDKEIAEMISNRLDYIDPESSVFVIGRTRRDLYVLGYGDGPFAFSSDGKDSGSVGVVYRTYDEHSKEWTAVRKLRFLTAHSAKGLEADYVFVIADRERGGFPNDTEDDMGSLFYERREGIEYAEERRVFYVALTRARKKLFIINRTSGGAALSSDSPFMKELIEDNLVMLESSTPVCPVCSGPMKIREVPGRKFMGCCDYPVCRGTLPFRRIRFRQRSRRTAPVRACAAVRRPGRKRRLLHERAFRLSRERSRLSFRQRAPRRIFSR